MSEEATTGVMADTATRRRFWALDPMASLFGLAAAVLSVTPSLVPRPALLQGALAALLFGIGYLLGAGLAALLRRMLRRHAGRAPRWWWPLYAVLWLVALAGLSVLAVYWQNEVRGHVEMPPLAGAHTGLFLAGFVPVAAVLIVSGKLVRGMWSGLRRTAGTGLAWFGSTLVVAAVLAAFSVAVMVAIDAIYLERNGAPRAELREPASAFRSAGPDSAIAWESLGRHGGDFVAGGPSAADIRALTGQSALTPIRVYAGVESAPTMRERAELIVAELERTGAFERAVLVVATPTGSGWLEAQAVDAVEYLHGGNTAIAAMQYAYTPSWVSFLFDPDAPVASARILFDAVEERWLRLPANERPLLLSYGLSLGAHGSQATFADLDDMRARTDGALIVGSPGSSKLWRTLQAARDAGSPAWQPVLEAGRQVRWMSQLGDESRLPGPWAPPRVLYLQHATDAVTWLSPELLWRAPEWLEPEQRADDVSSAMRWIPIVTALQVTVDMLGGTAVPARHGHNFGDVLLSGWREVSGDGGLDAAAMARIQAKIESYAAIPPFVVE